MTKHNTAIEWTHIPGFKGETWNPIVGCDIVSKGCTNCYAMRVAAKRLDGNERTPHYAGTTRRVNDNEVWSGKIARAPDKTWLKPFSWRQPRSVFVNSMGDLFHESVPDDWISQAFAAMACNERHIFIILTKRPERMRDYCRDFLMRLFECEAPCPHPTGWRPARELFDFSCMPYALPNVWLGVSVEDQATADERIPPLLATPAAVRFASCEPLLGPVDLTAAWDGESALNADCWGECAWCREGRPALHNCRDGNQSDAEFSKGRSGLDWVITGGESGKDARPMHPDWARSLRDQCTAAQVPFFFKQWGEWYPGAVEPDGPDGPEALPDIEHDRNAGNWRFKWADFDDSCGEGMLRLGKNLTGHLLDGKQHFAWPECVRVPT